MQRSEAQLREHFEQRIMPIPEAGCWLWMGGLNVFGYGTTCARDGSSQLAHRVAWEMWRGQIPDGMNVLHTCDVRCCINPAHLFVGTQSDNVSDMCRKGRYRHGKKYQGVTHKNAKLSAADVGMIRSRYADGRISMAELGKQYGIGAPYVWAIIHRKRRAEA